MQNIHYVAALDNNARFVHFFQVEFTKAHFGVLDWVGQQLGQSDVVSDEVGRGVRATFAECLYSGDAQECVVEHENGQKLLIRFERVVQKTDRPFHSDDEVAAIAIACDLPSQVELTAREREIVRLICQDKSNAEIAGELGVKSSTVETHRQNIRQKLGVKGTSGIVLYAVRHGLADA